MLFFVATISDDVFHKLFPQWAGQIKVVYDEWKACYVCICLIVFCKTEAVKNQGRSV